MFEWSGEASLAALFAAAFVSAAVLPANSEIVLAAALVVATLGNTLGGLTTYGLGRLVPAGRFEENRATRWVRRHGAPVLLLAWLPLVGDALCAAAGWLRVPVVAATLAMAAGKAVRYVVIAQGVALL